MRLMQAIAGAPYGGAEAFFVRLAVALNRVDDLAQRVVIRRDAARAATLGEHGVDFAEVSFGGRLDVRTSVLLGRLVEDFRPDILLTWMNRATAMAPPGRHVLVGRLGGYYDLKYYRRCDHLICNTPDLVRYVVEGGWRAERATYVPNFVNEPAAGSLSRAALGVPEDALLLLAMGRLHRNKGFDVLLSALPDMPRTFLLLAGWGPEEADLRQRALALGVADRVRFLGWRSDVGELLRVCDICVCPSRHEPLGNVVLEAWAAARPVVAAAAEGPRQLLEHGTSGILVPPDDAAALAAAIIQLAARSRRMAALAAAGHAAYERDYSEAVVVQRYIAFFQQVRQSCAASPE